MDNKELMKALKQCAKMQNEISALVDTVTNLNNQWYDLFETLYFMENNKDEEEN